MNDFVNFKRSIYLILYTAVYYTTLSGVRRSIVYGRIPTEQNLSPVCIENKLICLPYSVCTTRDNVYIVRPIPAPNSQSGDCAYQQSAAASLYNTITATIPRLDVMYYYYYKFFFVFIF